MSKTINVFKNDNTGNSMCVTGTEITNIHQNNGLIAIDFTGMTTARTITGIDRSTRVVNAWMQCTKGKTAHTMSVYNGTSQASKLLVALSAIGSTKTYVPIKFEASNADIAKDGYLTILVAGASWAKGNNQIAGTLFLQTMPN